MSHLTYTKKKSANFCWNNLETCEICKSTACQVGPAFHTRGPSDPLDALRTMAQLPLCAYQSVELVLVAELLCSQGLKAFQRPVLSEGPACALAVLLISFSGSLLHIEKASVTSISIILPCLWF